MRSDGRKNDEMRPIEAKVGILKNTDGSAFFKIGKTTAIVGVFGPRKVFPRRQEMAEQSVLRVKYNMAPFATTERNRPGPSRRSTEISMVTREALSSVLFLNEFPKTAIDVNIEILEADASTRCAGINAASMALANAGVPMRDIIVSCSAGEVNGEILLDIAGKEDTEGELDMPIAYYSLKKQITLLQMDGIADKKELLEILKLAISGCEKIYEKIRKTLKKKYKLEEVVE